MNGPRTGMEPLPRREGAPASAPLPEVTGATAFSLGRLPRIEFGAGRFAMVPDIVARHGRRVLLVTGGRSFAGSPRRAWLEEALRARGCAIIGSVAVTTEPSPAVIDGAVAAHRGSDVDVVLAIGGGSALDAAKAIAGLLRTTTSVRDHIEGLDPLLPYPGPSVPLIAVPTTAGTGSEATRNAVISEPGPAGWKASFRDERLVAAEAVIDPDLLAGAPRPLIAANGMDALTQLLESYVSPRSTPVTDVLALAGLEAARDALLAWHADPDGPTAPSARTRMAWAALLSGICLANAGLGAVHGLAAGLGGLLPIPHGAACGVVLARTEEVNIRALQRAEPGSPMLARFAVLGRLLAGLSPGASDVTAREALVDVLGAWTEALGIPGLASAGLQEAGIPAVVAASRGSSMRNNPVVLGDEELTAILRAAM